VGVMSTSKPGTAPRGSPSIRHPGRTSEAGSAILSWSHRCAARTRVGKVDTAAEVVPYPARMPPSMVNSAPVQYDEFSEARNAASRPTSSGLPTRGTGRFEKCSSST
jgi:hypothetical protein